LINTIAIRARRISGLTSFQQFPSQIISESITQSFTAANWTEQPGLPLVLMNSKESGITVSQEPFTVHQKSPKQLEWKIPIAYPDISSTKNSARIFLLEQKSATLPDIQPSQNVKLNAGDIGYFRTQYDGAHFEKLVASAAQLPEADKVNLASDAWALVQADRGSISDYFKLVETLREENSLALWEQITATLSTIDFLYLGNSERAGFQAYGRSLRYEFEQSAAPLPSWHRQN
jgi:aminopeptidase N